MQPSLTKLVKRIMLALPFPVTKNEAYDRLTRKVIKKVCQPDSICVDIGTNEGKILQMMLQAAPQARHFAFEPIPALFDTLQQQYGLQANIYNLALCDHAGTSSFNLVITDMAYSGLIKRPYDKAEEDTQIQVQTGLLDQIIPADIRPVLIKMDVEGAELLVLKGAVQTILRSKPLLLFEFGKAGATAYGYNETDMYRFITDVLRYKIYTLSAWLSQKSPIDFTYFSANYRYGKEFFFLAAPM